MALGPKDGERRACTADIPRLREIRGAVLENRLSDPASVTEADYHRFVTANRVWVTERAGRIAGFAAGDAGCGTIWALFVDPACEGAGIGPRLLDLVCRDLRLAGHTVARLSTDPGTRADRLYRRLGWADLGLQDDGEVLFERRL